MKQARNTKKALLSSVLSLVICLTMLIGTTFAWFTDSVTSANNIIKSGNLKVSLEYMDGTKEVADVESNEWKDASQEAIFDYSLWEPGYVSVRHIKIGNEGSLALKYMVAIEANGEVSKLADVIDVYYVDPAQKIADRTALTDANKLGTLTEVLGKLDSTAAGNLAAGSADRITIALKMQETAGNEYQNLSIGTDFSVKVFATQLAAENDSFGPDYDEDAYLPVVRSLAQLRNAIADGQSVRLGSDISVEEDDAENGNAIYYTGDESITIDLNGHTFTGNTSNVVFRFQKAAGGAENTITIKNGKIVAGEDSWSAVSVGSSADTKTNVKLSNLTVEACKRNDFAVRARSGANITMNDCIVNANAYGGGVAAGGGEVTMNNVTIKQSGLDASAPWNSAAFGISGGGKMTINSGSYYAAPKSAADGNNQGTSHGSYTGIIMNSGGTLIINGGTFTNDNYGENSLATAARGVIEADTGAVVEINGGEFNGLKSILAMTNNLGDASKNPSATLKGGTFSADPRVSGLHASNLIKVAEGHEAIENGDGTWTVSRDYIAVPTVGTDKKANGEALADVMNSATEASYLKLGAGEYSMPSIGGSKDITIVGSKETVIDVTMGAYLDGSKVTFEGVTIKGSTGMANGNGSDYAAMYTPDVTYINCTFDGAFRVGRDGATFINCTFNNLGDNYVWNMNNDTVFEGCTFNSDGKALLIYADGPSADQVASVVVKNCIFKSTKGAKAGAIANQNCAAIEMQNYGCSIELTVEGNTYDSNFSGEWRIKSYENRGYSITVNGTNYNTIAIDGKTMTIDSNKNVTVNN